MKKNALQREVFTATKYISFLGINLIRAKNDILEKETATHSGILAWRIPGTEEPGGLPSMGSHRVGHDWSDLAAATSARMIFMEKIKIIQIYFNRVKSMREIDSICA